MFYKLPIENNQQTTRIYIFGAGEIGNNYQQQIDSSDGIVINLGFIDNFVTMENVKFDSVRRIGVHKPEILTSVEYDYIVLACNYKLIPEICECLFKIGVNYKQILMGDPVQSKQSYTHTPNLGNGWNDYYEYAEEAADKQVQNFILPLIDQFEFSFDKVLDFPSGCGRIAKSLYKVYNNKIGKLICCDANADAIDFCRQRFSDNNVFDFTVNKVDNWQCIPFDFLEDSFSFIYSWDAMVHFSYKWLDFYIGEFYRICQNGGHVLIHHSNFGSPDVCIGQEKSEQWSKYPHWRSNISAEDMSYISKKNGFQVAKQKIIDWGREPKLDCITILRKL
jgi:SAM-dependent methyltransferase